MDGSPQVLTIDVVLKAYNEAKDSAEAMSKRHAEEMAPLQKRMELCKAWLLKFLIDNNLDNAKSEFGLAYKSTVMSATVDPEGGWEHILRFVLEAGLTRVLDALEQGATPEDGMDLLMAEPALALLNRSVNKTSVKDYLDQGKEVPGVKIAHIVNLNVRRS
jgi:hypothetical protein